MFFYWKEVLQLSAFFSNNNEKVLVKLEFIWISREVFLTLENCVNKMCKINKYKIIFFGEHMVFGRYHNLSKI